MWAHLQACGPRALPPYTTAPSNPLPSSSLSPGHPADAQLAGRHGWRVETDALLGESRRTEMQQPSHACRARLGGCQRSSQPLRGACTAPSGSPCSVLALHPPPTPHHANLQIRTIVAMRGRPWPVMPVLLVTCYSIMTALIARGVYGSLSTAALMPIENMNLSNVISYMGLCVFLLLAFRNNSSYGRWIEGAQRWHEVTVSLRAFGVPASAWKCLLVRPPSSHPPFHSPSETSGHDILPRICQGSGTHSHRHTPNR